ncbi:competence type IV pilus major pilin ComGC [Bacillus andreraoultii]|uniref:competence type IV pilus major pilin ComGC n=1 Tax=Bacillus andreraoultii TaxID=1499685 RepID=UPI000A6E20CE|nr:competence type IV pilus major pilin ComGC [Bacillus andreraoultii]
MWKNDKGFTLIEMMIVLFVITILLLITIPNVTKHQSSISSKGCEGLENMVQAEIQAYQIDHNKLPTSISDLKGGYLKEEPVCPDGRKIIVRDGEAVIQ